MKCLELGPKKGDKVERLTLAQVERNDFAKQRRTRIFKLELHVAKSRGPVVARAAYSNAKHTIRRSGA